MGTEFAGRRVLAVEDGGAAGPQLDGWTMAVHVCIQGCDESESVTSSPALSEESWVEVDVAATDAHALGTDAATCVQAAYRRMLARRAARNASAAVKVASAAVKVQACARGMLTRKQWAIARSSELARIRWAKVRTYVSVSISRNASAAVKVQACARGMLTRKQWASQMGLNCHGLVWKSSGTTKSKEGGPYNHSALAGALTAKVSAAGEESVVEVIREASKARLKRHAAMRQKVRLYSPR